MSELKTKSLEQQLKAYIAENGPISARAFIEACLYDPEHGYYRAGNPIGADGDFITAPEISQMFGEMIGIWCVMAWQAMGQPLPLQLIELGPGRGTLMSDVLRSLAKLHPRFETVSVHLVERSVNLRASQVATLDKYDIIKKWYNSLAEVPNAPSLIIANEFLDCLPIRQFIKLNKGWRERMVGLNEAKDFCFISGSPIPEGMIIPSRFANAPDGSIFEHCPDFESVINDMQRIAANAPLASLFVDYGFEGPQLGETLQAVKGHKKVSPFTTPGDVDLTAHVDFTALGALAVARGFQSFGPRDQGAFLSQLGIGARAEILVENASEGQVEKIANDVVRLVAPEQMGSLFKAFAITSHGIKAPPPFDKQVETVDAPAKS